MATSDRDGQDGNVPEKSARGSGKAASTLLLCPLCGEGASTGPGSTQRRNKAGDLPRTRRCKNDHTVRTLERVVGLTVADMSVRHLGRNGRGKATWVSEPFDAEDLGRRIHRLLFGVLEPDECQAVAAAVEAKISLKLVTPDAPRDSLRIDAGSGALPLPKFVGVLKEPDKSSRTFFLRSEQIRDFVLEQLREVGRPPGGGGNARFRAAHIIYALQTHGRLGRATMPLDKAVLRDPVGFELNFGWATAREFVAWLEGAYDDLDQVVLPSPVKGRRGSQWWRPTPGPLTQPEYVVKRHRKLRRRGTDRPYLDPRAEFGGEVYERALASDAKREDLHERIVDLQSQVEDLRSQIDGTRSTPMLTPALAGVPYEPFVPDKFLAAVRGALGGRRMGDDEARNVCDWVLWDLVGQEVVLSSQLGAGVAQCLRRLDDIAYLRWVIVAKELRVTGIHREAVGLIEHPSPALSFNPERVAHVKPRDHRETSDRSHGL